MTFFGERLENVNLIVPRTGVEPVLGGLSNHCLYRRLGYRDVLADGIEPTLREA